MATTPVYSLEDTCFNHILGLLANGEYSIDHLSLLPRNYRFHLLSKCPPAVIHQLENTQFTVGIDMELIWRTMYEQYIQPDDADSSMPSADLNGAIDDLFATVLTSYSGLKKLSITVRGNVSVDLEKFIAITKHQSSLEMISITTIEIQEYKGCICGGKPIATHSPKFSLPLLDSWYQFCLAKPTLHHITLNLSPITARFLVQAVIDFLSTPCSQEQTLNFANMSLGEQENVNDTPWYQKPKEERKLFKNVEVDMSELKLKHFDSQHTLQHKSLEFSNNCRFTPTFISFFLKLPPFKLKKLSYGKTTWLSHNPERDAFFVKLFAQQHFDMQTLELVWIELEDATFDHYDALFQKESLETVIIDCCQGTDNSALEKAASLHGFTFDEEFRSEFGSRYVLTRTL